MSRFELPVETITPLFLGGAFAFKMKFSSDNADSENRYADFTGQPELRPPSVRGALRYWLRALLGGAYGDRVDGIARITDTESRVFGSASGDEGCAGSISVRITNKKAGSPVSYAQHKHWDPSERRNVSDAPGKDYLYWSMNLVKHKRPSRCYIPEGSKFSILLTNHGHKNPDDLRLAAAAAWLLINLGGIGARSRRTAGGIGLPQNRSINLDQLIFQRPGNDIDSILDYLKSGISTIRSWVGTANPAFAGPPEFDVLTPDYCRIWVINIYRSDEKPVEIIGKSLQDWRQDTHSQPDGRNIFNWLQNQPVSSKTMIEKAVFGLPLPYHYFLSGGGHLSGVIQGKKGTPAQPGFDRRASPLWLKVMKTENGGSAVVATLFKSKFLPMHEKLYATAINPKPGGQPPPLLAPPDYSLIEDWIAKCFPTAKEVTYE